MRDRYQNMMSAAVLVAVAVAGRVQGGSLDPTNAPGPTMHSLEEIYQKVNAFVAPRTLSPTSAVVQAGYYAATNLTQVDTDLSSGNIAENVTIFGVAGTLNTHTGVQYYVIGGEGFVPGGNVDYFNTYGNGGAYIVTGSGAMVAPVHLPNGAVVTEFRVYYYDNSTNDLDVSLESEGFSSGYFLMASVSTSGKLGYASGVDTTIGTPTIDNTSRSYLVYAYAAAWDPNLRIKAAVIAYNEP